MAAIVLLEFLHWRGRIEALTGISNAKRQPSTGPVGLVNAIDSHKTLAQRSQPLGLALCRKICERHGGPIRAETNKSEGTTFSFDLGHAATEGPKPD